MFSDEYYEGPIQTIELLIDERKKAIAEKVKWTSNLQVIRRVFLVDLFD